VILSLLGFIVANGAVALAARRFQRALGPDGPGTGLLVFLLLRVLLISSIMLFTGVAHLLRPWVLGAAGLAGLILMVALGAHRGLRPPAFARPGRLLTLAAVVVGVRLLLQVWFYAPHLGDPLAYHLPKIAEWVQAGGFTREMGLHPHATFPAGFELIETWWVVFFHHDVLIEMAGVEFLVLAAAATYSMARSLSMPPPWAFFAALLYALIPGLHLTATSCLNDGPAAALVVASAAVIIARLPDGLLLMTAGLGLGIKPTYGFTLPGLILLRVWTHRVSGPPMPAPLRLGVALASMGLVAGGYWYARNGIEFGNPFHPLGGTPDGNPVAVQFGPSLRSFWLNLSDLVGVRAYDHRAPYGANVDHSAGWGPVPFACGVVALLVGARTQEPLRRLAAAFAVSLACCLLFVRNDPWCLKYVFFFPAVLCLATASLSQTSPAVLGIATAALMFSFVGTMSPYDLSLDGVRVLASQGWRGRTALLLSEPPLRGPEVACFGGFRANSYLLYGPDFSRRVAYLRVASGAALMEEMAAEGVRILYAVPEDDAQRGILEAAIRTGGLVHLGGSFYELSPED